MATDSQMPDSDYQNYCPDADANTSSQKQTSTIFDISPANPSTTFWLLDKEEIVFQPDGIGIASTYSSYYTVSKTNKQERILNPITQ
jgi:hypothetical protein